MSDPSLPEGCLTVRAPLLNLHIMPQAAANWLITRTSLLTRLNNHADAASWEDFCDSYGRVVYGVAMKAGLNAADAEDIVQETMIAVARHLPQFRYDPQKGSFKSWLLTIARSKIWDCLRRKQRERRFDAPPPEGSSETSLLSRVPDENPPDLAAIFDGEWERGLFEAAKEKVRASISPQQYQIFDLHVVREWPVEKITATLGVTANQVYLAKHRVSESISEEVARLERATTS